MSLCSRLRIAPGASGAPPSRGPLLDHLARTLQGVRAIRLRASLAWPRRSAASTRLRDSMKTATALGPAGRAGPTLDATTPRPQPLPCVGDLAAITRRRKIAAPVGQAEVALKTGRARLVWVALAFGLAFMTVAIRLTSVALFTDRVGPRIADAQQRMAPRADILDRNGQMLATSVVTASLYANAREIIDPGEAVAALLSVLPALKAKDLMRKLSSDKTFVWLYRDLTPRQHQRVNDLGIPGLYFETRPRRIYPQGALAAHAVGFVDLDDRGLAGIERGLDDRLRTDGRPVRLTLDMRVQHMLRDELAFAMRKHAAIGAAAVVLDAETSEIVAMVSLPDFDPDDPGSAPDDARFNRASLGAYEIGSPFKVFTAAMALDSQRIRLTDRFDATQPIRISRFEINDLDDRNEWLTVAEIFKHSSNIGAARMAIEVGRDRHRAFLDKLGLLSAPDLALPEIGEPIVPEHWRDINTMTIAFGHGLAVPPIQLANAAAAMVNGGKLNRPRLLYANASADGGDRVSEESTQVISPNVSAQIRQLMHTVVTDGTGRRAAALGYRVGGKTGSAEKSGGRHGYRRTALLSSFLGAFPMDAPRYVVFAMLDEPKGTEDTKGYATGGWVAAPIVGRFVARAAPLLRVEPDILATEAGRAVAATPVSMTAGRRVTSAYAESETLSPEREALRATR